MELQRRTTRGHRTVTLAALAAVLALAPGQVLSQAQRLPGVIDRPVQDYVPDPGAVPEPGVPPATEPQVDLPPDADEVVAMIDRIEFEGNESLSTRVLSNVVESYEGREITKGDIARLKYDISKAYYDRGYVLVRVVTPPQSLAGGTLLVRIFEARLGGVEVDNTTLRDGLAHHYADRLPLGEVFRERPVESAISDITSLMDVEASMTLKPGQQTGETDAVVSIREVDEDRQQFTVDNYGSKLTGEAVARLDLQKGNALGLGETLGLGLRASDEDLRSIFANVVVPTGVSNVLLELDALYSENDIGDFLEALNSTGESTRYGVALSKALVNTRAVKNTVRMGYEARHHESFLDGVPETDDHIRQGFLEMTTASRFGSTLVTYLGLRYNKGLDSGADDIGEVDASRAGGDPQADIFRLTGYVGVHPTPRNTLSLSFYGQATSDLLLSSDIFAIGGYGSVRGFEPAQEVGDEGYQASLQYSYLFGGSGRWGLKTGLFYDVGHVTSEIPGETLDDTLESAGVNLELSTPSGNTRVVFDWATPVGEYLAPDIDDNSYYLRISQSW